MANETVNRYLNIYIESGEAERVLDRLEKKEASLNAEIAKGGKQAEKFKQELAGLQEPLERARKKVSGELNPSLKETEAGVRRVRNELRSMSSSDAGYNKVVQQFKQGTLELDQQRQKMGLLKSTMKSFWQEAKTVAAGVLIGNTVQAAVMAITGAVSNMVSSSAKLSDSLADVQRVTGMTKEEVKQLNSELGKIDTRTSVAGLREIAVIAGKLGVAKTDILGFTEAVDKLVVALGDELGDADQITTQLGKILNVFDGKVTGDNITRLGNAFVELANSGVASGAFLSDFDQRLSGVAKTAGISLGQLTGLGAGLEEMGARVESSSTAVQKLLISIGGDIPKAAKIAGKSVQEFNQTFSTNATEAMLQYAEGLTKNKGAFSEVVSSFKDAGEEGARVIEVLSSMGQNADMLRGRIELGSKAMQETNAINDAFALKNETLGASLDKLGKVMHRIFIASGITEGIQQIADGVTWLAEPTKSASQEYETLASKINQVETNIVPLLGRYEELKHKTTLNKEEQKELKDIMGKIADTIPGAVTQWDNYGYAIAISTGKVKEFIKESKSALRILNQSAIEEYTKKFQETVPELVENQRILREGTLKKTVTTGPNAGMIIWTKANEDDLKKARANVESLQELRMGYKKIIDDRSGANFEKQLTSINTKTGESSAKTEVLTGNIIKNTSSRRNNNAATAKTIDFQKELNDLIDKYNMKAESSPLEKELLQLDKDFNTLREKIKDNYLQRLQLDNAYREAVLDIQFKYHQKELEAERDQREKLKKIIDTGNGKGINMDPARQAQGYISQVLDAQKRDAEALWQLNVLKSVGKARLQAQNDYLIHERDQKLKNTQLTEHERQLIIEETDRKIHENSVQFEVGRLNNILEAGQQALQVWQTFADAKTQKENQQLEDDRRRADQRRQILDDQLKAGVVSRLEHDRQIAKIEKDQAKREHEMRVKQFRRNQRMQIVSTIMSGAQSAINMLATSPWPVNIVMAALAAASTIAQVAVIAKQKPPEYARGGMLQGPSHSENKGMPVTDPRTGQTQAYLEGGESIINKRSMADRNRYTVSGTPSQIASLLNAYHGGVHWESGATMQPVWYTPPRPMNFGGIRKAYAQGGIYYSTTINNTGSSNNDVMQNMLVTQQYLVDTVARLNRKLDEGIKSYTVLSESEAQKQRYDSIVNDATMK